MMETENQSGTDPKEIQKQMDFQEARKAINDALTRANIHGCVADYEELPDDAELEDPVDRLRVEFGCLEELDRLLRILKDSIKVSESDWDYSLRVVDPSQLSIHVPDSDDLWYMVDAMVPTTDLPKVLEILQKHYAKPENRRPSAPTTNRQDPMSSQPGTEMVGILHRDEGKLSGEIVFDPPLKIHGDGSSIRGRSAGTFSVERITVRCREADESYYTEVEIGQPYRVNTYGPNTNGLDQYTDELIEKEMTEIVAPIISAHFGCFVTRIYWSEQGAQTDHHWNFDCDS
jgi:hypothetical protein